MRTGQDQGSLVASAPPQWELQSTCQQVAALTPSPSILYNTVNTTNTVNAFNALKCRYREALTRSHALYARLDPRARSVTKDVTTAGRTGPPS